MRSAFLIRQNTADRCPSALVLPVQAVLSLGKFLPTGSAAGSARPAVVPPPHRPEAPCRPVAAAGWASAEGAGGPRFLSAASLAGPAGSAAFRGQA